jgi:hypothetical protein
MSLELFARSRVLGLQETPPIQSPHVHGGRSVRDTEQARRCATAVGRILFAGILLAVCAVSLVGCGGASTDASVGPRSPDKLETPAEARGHGNAVFSEWLGNVSQFTRPRRPSRYRLITRATDPRLQRLARKFGFRVLGFTYVVRAQAAALTIQTARSRSSFAQDLPAIHDAVDPQHGNEFSYKGFFLEARDADAVPFIAVQHSISNARGQVEGEQWARSESLLPYAHG